MENNKWHVLEKELENELIKLEEKGEASQDVFAHSEGGILENKWDVLRKELENQLIGLQKIEEYRQRDLFHNDGRIEQTKIILSMMEEIEAQFD